MIKNLLNDERYYFEAFIKTVQYLETLTTHKNIMKNLETLVKIFYNSDFFAFYECGADGTIIEHRNEFSNTPFSKKGLEKIKETTVQVLESGFFASELINTSDPYAMVFLPISKANQIISVIVIGHTYSERLPKYLLNIYLALGGIIGTTIEKLTMIQELRTQHSKLKENDRFLTNIFSSVKDGICVIDTDHNIIRVNPTMKNWYSYMEPLLEKKCYQVFMNRTEQCKVCRLDELLKTNKPFVKVIPRKGNRGENLGILEIYMFPLHDQETGKSTGAIEYLRDITERRKAEQQLKESEEKVKTLNDIFLEFTDDPHKNIQLLVDAAGKLLMSDCAGYNKIIEVNGKKILKNIAIWQEPPEFEREDNPIGRICTDVINMNKDDILVLKDLDKTEYCKTDSTVLQYNLKQYCGIVVRLNNEPVAAFCVTYKKNRDMSESDKNIIRILSKSASIEEQRFNSYQKIKESEEKFRTLVSNIPGAVYRCAADESWTIEFLSDAIKDISGFPPSDFIQNKVRSYASIIHPDDVEMVEKIVYSATDKGEPYIIEYRIINSNGEVVWVYEKGRGILGEDGEILWLDGAIFDITERKQTEIKLKESEEKYRYLIENSLEGVWVIDSNANAILVNPSMAKMLGYTIEEMIGKSLFFFMDEKEIKNTKRHLERRKNGISEERDSEMIHKNGKKVYLRIRASPIFDIEGNYNGTFAFLSNITQRKLTEQNLKESEAKYRNLFESSPNMIVLLNPNGRIIDANPATFAQYGFERRDFIDKDFRELNTFLPENLPILVKKFKELLTKGVLEPMELPFYTKDGNIIWVNIQGSLVKIGGETYIQTVIQDINEQKEAEEELNNLHNLKSELISRTSHELKTPLTSIKGFTQLLMTLIKDKIDEKNFSYFDYIIRGINRLENLIQSVIRTSQLSTGTIKLNKTYENLSSLINLGVKDLEDFAKLRNHTITIDIHDYLMTKFENEQILHVLNNLISNAIKYTPTNGKIEIKSQIKEKFYIISIKDNGIGFTQDEKNRIFKQFGKIEHYGQGFDVYSEGSGFGLYISKKIIELHDGNIWMESEGRDKGSSFNFSLPIIK